MSNHPELHELYRQYTESNSKYVYFLLAAAGASLGFALQKLDDLPLTWRESPAILAMAFWLISLLCGCKRITWTHSTMYANYLLLQLQYGLHPEQPPPQILPDALIGVRTGIEKNSSRARTYFRLQFWFLALGVIAFVAWNILEMALRTL